MNFRCESLYKYSKLILSVNAVIGYLKPSVNVQTSKISHVSPHDGGAGTRQHPQHQYCTSLSYADQVLSHLPIPLSVVLINYIIHFAHITLQRVLCSASLGRTLWCLVLGYFFHRFPYSRPSQRFTTDFFKALYFSVIKESKLTHHFCDSVYLSCYGHSVEHIPQDNANNHFVSQVEDDPFAIVISVLVYSRSRCGRGHCASGRVLCFTFRADPSSWKTFNKKFSISLFPQSPWIFLLYTITICLTRECMVLPDCSVAALGVSLAVALANTPTVGRLLSTIPIAS